MNINILKISSATVVVALHKLGREQEVTHVTVSLRSAFKSVGEEMAAAPDAQGHPTDNRIRTDDAYDFFNGIHRYLSESSRLLVDRDITEENDERIRRK